MFFGDYQDLDETLKLFDKWVIPVSNITTEKRNNTMKKFAFIGLLIFVLKIAYCYWKKPRV